MKIVLFVHQFHPDIGGVEMTAQILANGWTTRFGDEVTVITHTRANDESVSFPFRVLREPSWRQQWQAVRAADVVFHNNPCMQFAWSHLLQRRSWVVALRQWITQPDFAVSSAPSRLKLGIKYGLVERADAIVANSQATANHVGGVDRVIPNSYRDTIFTTTNTAPRDRRSLVYLGRLDIQHKGVDLLLDALDALAKQGLDPRLTVIGDGVDLPFMRQRVDELGLGARVTFLGRLDGVESARVLNQHAIAVIPSRQPETFGTVALEAAACGCVPVVAGHGGLPQAAGPTGPHVTPNDLPALVAALEQLMTDEAVYARYASAIADHVRGHRESVMVDAYREVLLEAANGLPRRPLGGTLRRFAGFIRRGRWTVSDQGVSGRLGRA